jgi:hypothetical protein
MNIKTYRNNSKNKNKKQKKQKTKKQKKMWWELNSGLLSGSPTSLLSHQTTTLLIK